MSCDLPGGGLSRGAVTSAKRAQDVAIINEDTLFPKTSAQGTAELAKKAGMQVVFTEAYPKGNQDFSAVLTKIKAVNPDVLAAATYFDDAVALARQMRELSVNPKMLGVTVGGDIPKFQELLKGTAEYIYGASQWEATLPYPGAKEFNDAYIKQFKREPSYHSAAGYAGCMVYAEGVKKAGTLDADKVREALLVMKSRTMFGDYQWTRTAFGRPQDGPAPWQDGKRVVVWPDDHCERQPRFPTPP